MIQSLRPESIDAETCVQRDSDSSGRLMGKNLSAFEGSIPIVSPV